MSQLPPLQGKLKYDIEYKVPVEKIHEFWRSSFGHIPKLSPNIVQNVELVEGRWGNEGCTHNWTYNIDGKVSTSVLITEEVDCKKKYISFKVIGGDLLEPYYKSFKFVVQFTPKDDGGSMGSWILVYEKLNENVPDPISMREKSVQINKDIDAYLTQA
ncbi:hypothetical protein SLEP1_g46509 [Rubroshorea leprosula]|uniref:Bet v I/Major latex protein domain-containing protein n=1 Tax=Rubroshorea leprosula TaxID=152421 RepID=A0AAV5LMJ1_9ROSI|nr:hypothetical protein SLEP1_g46509 [Rubroshorea leprosula]